MTKALIKHIYLYILNIKQSIDKINLEFNIYIYIYKRDVWFDVKNFISKVEKIRNI